MDNSKAYQTELSYANSAGSLSINLFNQKITYYGNSITLGNNQHTLNVNFVYNSLLELKNEETHVGKNWKLNVQEYLYYDELKDQYTYIDGSGVSHILEKLMDNVYYDTSGLGYTLKVSNEMIITDIYNNQLKFYRNHLVEKITVDGVDLIYEYEDDKIVSFYSKNHSYTKLIFLYNLDGLLKEIVKYVNNLKKESYKCYYFGSDKLRLVSKKYDFREIEMLFYEYVDERLVGVFNLINNETLKLTFDNKNHVKKVITGKATLKEKQEEKTINYLGDELYFDGGVYLGEKEIKKEKYIEMGSKVKSNTFIFGDNYVEVENDKQMRLIYYLNILGKTTAIFEKYNNTELRSLNELNGIKVCLADEETTLKINNESVLYSNESDIYKNVGEINFEYDNYNVIFWLNKRSNSTNNHLCLELIFESSDISNVWENIYEYYLDNNANNSWQQVLIPIHGVKDKVLTSVGLHFTQEDEDVVISNLSFIPSSYSKVMIEGESLNDGSDVEIDLNKITNFECVNPENIIVKMDNHNNYITSKDLLFGYLQDFFRGSDANYYLEDKIIFLNNLQKAVLAEDYRLVDTNNTEFALKLYKRYMDEFEVPYYVVTTDMSGNKKTTKKVYLYKKYDLFGDNSKSKYIVVEEKIELTTTNKNNPDETITKSATIYKYYDLYGRIVLSIDEHGIETIYTYHNTQNERVIKHKDSENEDNIISVIQSWDINKYSTIQKPMIIDEFYEETNGLLDIYKEEWSEDGIVSDLIIRKDYNYGLEESKYEITFKRESDTNTVEIGKNTIFYDDEEKLSTISDNKNSYSYEYNIHDELEKVIDDNTEQERLVINNNIYSNVISETNNGNETTTIYNKYGKIESYEANGLKANYVYETVDTSPLNNKIKKITFIKDGTTVEKDVYDTDENNLLKSHTIKRKYDRITYVESGEAIASQVENIVNCRNSNDTEIYVSVIRDENNQYYGNDELAEEEYGDLYCSYNEYEENILFNPYITTNNTYIGVGNIKSNTNSAIDNLGFVSNLGYDEIGRNNSKVVHMNYTNFSEIKRENEYFPQTNLLISEKIYVNNIDSNNPYYFLSYDYLKGNLKEISITNINNTQETYSYEYDIRNQLYKEILPFDNLTKKYYYDNYGNITQKEVYDGENTTIYEYNYENNILVSITKDNELFYELEYDSNGNCVRYGNDDCINTLYWEHGNKLIQHYKNSNETTYDYDIYGRRTQKRVIGKKRIYYFYEGNKLLWEDINFTDSGTNKKLIYVYDQDGICGFVEKKPNVELKPYTYLKDALGNIIAITDGNTIVATYKYDAWGNHKVYDSTGNENNNPDFIGNINPFRYRGYYYDAETNLALVSSRYYSPELGRFIQPADVSSLDPQSINGLNLYTYALNNPIAIKYDSSSYGNRMVSSIDFGTSSTGASNVSNQTASEWFKLLVGALPDLKVGLDYLKAQGTKSSFAYATAKTYRFPILDGTHSAFTKGKYSYGDLVGASFRKITTDSARGGFGVFAKKFAKNSLYTLGVNFVFNFYENNWQIDDAMVQDTLIDTAIGVSSYYMAAGTMSLLTAGALVAFGWNVPGLIVVGGVVVLSIAYDALIRWITGYDE